MRAFLVVSKAVELALLGGEVARRGPGGFRLQGAVHTFMSAMVPQHRKADARQLVGQRARSLTMLSWNPSFTR